MQTQRLVLRSVALFATLAITGNATAQVYPARPVTMVVPFAAGGPTDTLARILADRMRMSLNQPVVVENTAGAAGTVGVGRVARAAPDGYTLSIGNSGTHVLNGATHALPYDLFNDFQPVALLADNHSLIVAKNVLPAKDLNELIAWTKANKGSAGTSGAGAVTHIAGILFQNLTGANLQFVPYRGAGPALQDLVSGQIDLMFDQASNSLPHLRAGRIRAYAAMTRARLSSAPDIPTVDEAGLPGFYMSVWHALWVPTGTPKEAVAKLNAAVVDALADPAVRKRLSDLAQEIPDRKQQTPEALSAHHKAEIGKWWPIIKAAGIKAE